MACANVLMAAKDNETWDLLLLVQKVSWNLEEDNKRLSEKNFNVYNCYSKTFQ